MQPELRVTIFVEAAYSRSSLACHWIIPPLPTATSRSSKFSFRSRLFYRLKMMLDRDTNKAILRLEIMLDREETVLQDGHNKVPASGQEPNKNSSTSTKTRA